MFGEGAGQATKMIRVLHQASWGRCVNDRGAILLVTSQIVKMSLELQFLSKKKTTTSALFLYDYRLLMLSDSSQTSVFCLCVFPSSVCSAVNAAVFTVGDDILSASDDQTVKVWDMRNFTVYKKKISTDSGVNRLVTGVMPERMALLLEGWDRNENTILSSCCIQKAEK